MIRAPPRAGKSIVALRCFRPSIQPPQTKAPSIVPASYRSGQPALHPVRVKLTSGNSVWMYIMW